MITRILYLLCFLTLIGTRTFSQEQFVQFTYYDQLAWSDDGNELAFRCVLLDESQPEKLTSAVLIKNFPADKLICLNPQPERFIISQDRKYLLFSSVYGIYLVALENQYQTYQIYFQNLADDRLIQNFGFSKPANVIYIQLYDRNSTETVQENLQFSLPSSSYRPISLANIKKLKKMNQPLFNLSLDETKGTPSTEIKIKGAKLSFLPETGTNQPGNFNLIFQSSQLSASPKKILEKCRPRLFSVNPDSSEVIVSVFERDRHKTYRFLLTLKKLLSLEDHRYFAVSWLDKEHYICLTEAGLFLRNNNLSLNQKIDLWTVPEWCQKIELEFPRYELQVDFEPDQAKAEQIASRLLQSGCPARIKFFKDGSKEGYRIRTGGFYTQRQAQALGEELKNKGFNYWVDSITDLYDYFNSLRPEVFSQFKHKTALIQYKLNHYLRSRVLLLEPNNKQQIIVPEMNTIPGRILW